MNIYDLISRAQKLRKETQLDSVSPDRVGGLHEDTLKYINEFQLLASSPSLHKAYASVSAMQSDKSPKSDLTGKPLKPGQLVVIVPANQTDATAGDVYRYDGPSGNTSAWTFVAKIGAVPADAELSATSTNPPQNKVVTEKLTELSEKTTELESEVIDATNKADIIYGITGSTFYSGSSFMQGIYQAGSGIIESLYNITTNPIPIKKGEVIVVEPNTDIAGFRLFNSDDIANATTLKNIPRIDSRYEYISEYDGYYVVSGLHAKGHKISPDSTSIVFGQSEMNAGQIAKKSMLAGNLATSVLTCGKVTIIEDCQEIDISETGGEIDASDYIMYNHSIKVVNGAITLRPSPINLIDNNLVIALKINSLDAGASVKIHLISSSSQDRATYELMRGNVNTVYGEWQMYTIPYSSYQFVTGAGDVNFEKIDYISVASPNGSINLQYIGIRKNALRNGIVTFTFDDGWKTQGDGIRILAEKGLSGTIFAIKSAMEANNDAYLSVEDMRNLVEWYGADIQVHGPSSFDDMEDSELDELLASTKKLLVDNGISQGNYMAYPNGFHSLRVVRIAKRYFKACRTIQYYIPFETLPAYNNYQIRAVSSITSADVEDIKALIDRAKLGKTWLILVFHKISEGTTGEYCSAESLSEIAQYALESGVDIMNFKDVMESSMLN